MGTRWRGLLAPINKPTGDGRRIAPGGFTSRPLPLPLKMQPLDANGHDASVVVGVIDQLNIDEEAGEVWGEGELFDDANPATTPQLAENAQTALTLTKRGVIGPSVDPGSAQATAVMVGMDRPPTMAEIQMFCDRNGGQMPPTEMLFTGYEIAGATLVPIPAFAEARPLELLEKVALTAAAVRSSGWDSLPIASRDRTWDSDAAKARLATRCGLDGDSPDWGCYASGFLYRHVDRDPHTRGAYSFPVVDVIDGERQLVPAGVYAAANVLSGGHGGTDIPADAQKRMRGVVAGLYKRMAKQFDDPSISAPWAGKMSALLAAARLPQLDGSLFLDPQLSAITPLTREDLGNGWTRVFGHIATHDVCHVGMRGACTTAPFSDQDYQTFHRYHQTQGGIELPLAVGRLTAAHGQLSATCRCCPGNDDHACNNVSFGAAVAHHDRMRVLAYGRVGEDEKNNAIWFAGVEAPEADDRDRVLLNRRKVSGDWRDVAGNMELAEILVLARREPGFPLPRVSMENGRQRSLTAASPIGAVLEREGGEVKMVDVNQMGAAIGLGVAAALGELGYNPMQKRGKDGKWISMGGGGSAGGAPDLPGRDGGSRKSEGGGSGAGGRDSGDRSEAREANNAEVMDAVIQARAANMEAGASDPVLNGLWDEILAARRQEWVERNEPGNDAQKRVDAAIDAARAHLDSLGGGRESSSPSSPATGPGASRRDDYNGEIESIAEDLLDRLNEEMDEGMEDDEDYERDEHADEDLARALSGLTYADGPEAENRAADELRKYLEEVYPDVKLPAITAAAQVHTGAMIALRPTEQDVARLAVTGGEDPDQLHLTLAYLGEADRISPEARQQITRRMKRVARQFKTPVAGDGFAVDVFNPGNANSQDTAIVMGVGGQPLADIHGAAMSALNGIKGLTLPEQHAPWVPHVTLQYTDDLNRVKPLADRVGPVQFDRLRLTFGGDVTDIPIGRALTAAEVGQLTEAVAGATAELCVGHMPDDEEADAEDSMCSKCDKMSSECASCSDCAPGEFAARATAARLALRATIAASQLSCCKINR